MPEESKLTPLHQLRRVELRMTTWLKLFDYHLECLASQTLVDLLQLVLFPPPNNVLIFEVKGVRLINSMQCQYNIV